MTVLLDAALKYAAAGFPVFPVGSGKDGKAPLTLHGFHDASRDEAVIREWWSRWPSARIGVPTGAITDLVVLDVDPRHGGDESLDAILQQHGQMPTCPLAATGGGGRHFWFLHPGGDMSNVVGFRPGLDIRADGGYVVVPPSGHQSGKSYSWEVSPFETRRPLIPVWLFKMATEHAPESYEGLAAPVNVPPPAENEEVLRRVFTGPNGALHRLVYEDHLAKEHTKDHPAYVAFCTALFLAGAQEEQVPRLLGFSEDSWNKFGRAIWRHLVGKGGYYRRHNTLIRVSPLYAEAEEKLKAAPLPSPRQPPPAAAPGAQDADAFAKFFDKRGIPIQNAFVESIMSDRHFATFADDMRNCLLYNNGIYDGNADAYVVGVVEGIHKVRGVSSSSHFRDEVTKAIRARTLVAREVFNPPGFLLVLNGVLDLTNILDPKLLDPVPVVVDGEKVTGGPAFTARVPVAYDPAATCPTFERVLEEWLPDQKSRDLLTEWFGYCLVPGNPYQVAMMLMGPGKNGKSTALGVLRDLLGPKSVSAESLQDLTGGKFSAAELWGKLANICPDVPGTLIKDTGKFKALLGGDLVSAQRKYGQPFTFINAAKAVFAANQMPDVDDETVAFWRRWLLVKFEYYVPEEKRIENLTEVLRSEHPGILNLALKGLARLKARGGFNRTGTVESAMQEWRRRANSLRWFVEEMVVPVADGEVVKADLYSAYTNFCDDKGIPPKESNRVGTELPQMVPGVKPAVHRVKEAGKAGKGVSTRVWVGIRLKDPPDDDDATPATGATGSVPERDTGAGVRAGVRAIDDYPVAHVAPVTQDADAVERLGGDGGADPEDLFAGGTTRADRARAAMGDTMAVPPTHVPMETTPDGEASKPSNRKRHTECELCVKMESHVCYACPRCQAQEGRYDDPADE